MSEALILGLSFLFHNISYTVHSHMFRWKSTRQFPSGSTDPKSTPQGSEPWSKKSPDEVKDTIQRGRDNSVWVRYVSFIEFRMAKKCWHCSQMNFDETTQLRWRFVKGTNVKKPSNFEGWHTFEWVWILQSFRGHWSHRSKRTFERRLLFAQVLVSSPSSSTRLPDKLDSVLIQ